MDTFNATVIVSVVGNLGDDVRLAGLTAVTGACSSGKGDKNENLEKAGTDHLVGGHNELKGTGCDALMERVGGEEGGEVGALCSGLLCCQHGFQHIVV